MPELFHPDRLQRLTELQELGVDPFPARSPQGRGWAAEIAAAAPQEGEGEGERVTLLGRVLGRRGYGKLSFLDVHDQTGKLQACLQKDRVPAGEFRLLKALNLGDFVAVEGPVGRTKTGEPTVFAERFTLLSKALQQPPAKWHGLQDEELRARLRYVDLFSNAEVRERFLKRARIAAAMRGVFAARGYTEVDTPVLHPIYGGANARPFITHHNALDMKLYLRIAPELYLKRLLVGGIERVVEFARVFRNEGISNRHNPEFTMIEFYEAYADYGVMAGLVEELVTAAAGAAGCAGKAVFRGEEFDLRLPFPRVRYRDRFREVLGFDPGEREATAAACAARGIPFPQDAGDAYGYWKAVNGLFEQEVEPALRGPLFLIDYPAAICPLTKPSAEDPEWAERFEFFLGGMELANAFSELNDPQLQLRKFEEQVADRDPETPGEVDYDYVRALAYGLPPAGGCGIGFDRLVMVLLGADSIREVLLFPHLRPEVFAETEEATAEVS